MYSVSLHPPDTTPMILVRHHSGATFGLLLRSNEARNYLHLYSSCCAEEILFEERQANGELERLASWEIELLWGRDARWEEGRWICQACDGTVPAPPSELSPSGMGPLMWGISVAEQLIPLWLDLHGVAPLEAELESLPLIGLFRNFFELAKGTVGEDKMTYEVNERFVAEVFREALERGLISEAELLEG